MTYNDKKTSGMVFGASNGNFKAIQVNINNVDWVTNATHLGNVILLRVLIGLWATSEAKCLLNVIFD